MGSICWRSWKPLLLFTVLFLYFPWCKSVSHIAASHVPTVYLAALELIVTWQWCVADKEVMGVGRDLVPRCWGPRVLGWNSSRRQVHYSVHLGESHLNEMSAHGFWSNRRTPVKLPLLGIYVQSAYQQPTYLCSLNVLHYLAKIGRHIWDCSSPYMSHQHCHLHFNTTLLRTHNLCWLQCIWLQLHLIINDITKVHDSKLAYLAYLSAHASIFLFSRL